MYDDVRIGSALATMIEGITPPPVPLLAILQKVSRPQAAAQAPPAGWLRPAVAAAAIATAIIVSVPLIAPGVVVTVEARLAQILQWTPPSVPPPDWLTSRLHAQAATLASAQARVSFRIVPPAGLPSDIRSSSVATSLTGIYNKMTRTWELGSQVVFFTYERSGNRSFTLLADRFDPRTGPPPRYMYEDTGRVRNGVPVLVRHEKFTWRNGDQIMSAIDGSGITADEIRAVQSTMHGVPIPVAETRNARDSGTIDKLYPGR
jgi:hypothetical protein